MNIQTKKDYTRLSNLLDRYRDAIITNLSLKLPSGYYPPVKIVTEIDIAIDHIKMGINKEK